MKTDASIIVMHKNKKNYAFATENLSSYGFGTFAQFGDTVEHVTVSALAVVRPFQVDTGMTATLISNETLIHICKKK